MARKAKTHKTFYYKLFGALWIIGFDILCAYTKLPFVGACLLVIIGSSVLAYGIILSENKPDFKPSRSIALTIAVGLADLVLYGWLYLFINGL